MKNIFLNFIDKGYTKACDKPKRPGTRIDHKGYGNGKS